MKHFRAALAALSLVGVVAIPLAFAETSKPVNDPAPTAATSKARDPSAATQVENWSKKEWSEAVAEWSNDKAKWTGCKAKSSARKLSGRKSWSFLYACMTG